MRKLEPPLIAVPSLLIATLMSEGLSKGVEYLEENLVWKATDCPSRRQLMIVGAILTLGK